MSYGSARKRALKYLTNMSLWFPQPRRGCGTTGWHWVVPIAIFVVVVAAVVKLIGVGMPPAAALWVVGGCGTIAAAVLVHLGFGPSTA